MKGRFLLLGILVAVIILPGWKSQGDSLEPATLQKNLLVVGWDGVQWAHLNEMLNFGRLPNLSRLISDGALVKVRITDHETSTKPGWTQIATGLPAKVSGVFSNKDFQPFPEGASVFEVLEKMTGRQIFTGFVAGKSHNLGSLGPGLIISGGKRGRRNETTGAGEPWNKAKGSFDLWFGDMGREADEVGQILLSMIRGYGQENQFAIFAHFADPDSAGHKFGENSKQYENAIIKCDEWLGSILKLLDKVGALEKSIIVVTTDHGFDEGTKSHRNAPDCFFAINDGKHNYEDGEMLDIMPTICALLGIDEKKLGFKLVGEPLFK